MEVAGVVLGAIALVGVFEDCVLLISQIGAAKSMEKDYIRLVTRLDFQKTLLLQWATRLNLFADEGYDHRLDDPELQPVVQQGLLCIRQLLQDGQELQRRYGVRPNSDQENVQTPTAISGRLMSRIFMESRLLQERRTKPKLPDLSSTQPYQLSGKHRFDGFGKIKWVIKDKAGFECLVQELSNLVTGLDKIVPPQQGDNLARAVLKEEITALRNVHVLNMVLGAATDDNSDLTSVTQAAIDRVCTRLILERLWFRTIDDRKNSIAGAHSRTLQWALYPPSSTVPWSDLSRWLRVEDGIYWISGKPGSGKSTLMKFLFNHPDVVDMLKTWAGDRDLRTAIFFLWNLGSEEQNSQQGLARGLLYHVLHKNQSLIPIVLPYMWQEAQSGALELKIPSPTELSEAFTRLGAESTNGAYVFFIDGLDEFTGNHRHGISFVETLANSANIKVLLSSRPIDTCVAAFSSKPKLALQDLTRHDIQLYVDDIIRKHSYIAETKALKGSVVDRLTRDLQKKADGVFLWVVLACRTLIEGFAAYDNAKELQARVDELPPELEDLFRHILARIPAGFLRQTAKLLRICYSSRRLQISDRISTLALAWAEEQDLIINDSDIFMRYSPDENARKCAILEGRLRSRCMGLLEVRSSTTQLRSTSIDRFNDSSVDFMHRTVFEFLNLPGVWKMDCLQVGDNSFDEMIVLSHMSCYLLFLQKEAIGNIGHLARDCLAHVHYIQEEAPKKVSRTVNSFTQALMQPRYLVQAHSTYVVQAHSTFELRVSPTHGETETNEERFFGQIPERHTALLLAVEADITSFVRDYDLHSFNGLQKLQYSRTKQHSLLYHAIKKPLLSTIEHSSKKLSPDMICILLHSGCDPNEQSSGFGHVMTTPWETWTHSRYMESSKPQEALCAAEITLLMITAGSLLGPPDSRRLSVHSVMGDGRAGIVRNVGAWLDLSTWTDEVFNKDRLVECCNLILETISSRNCA